MKKMVCEMCEGTEFLKVEGKFVCQGCGLQYTMEEAKKLMVDVEDTGIVAPAASVPQTNPQVENLLNLARNAYASKNYAQTEEFCNQVIAQDSQNYEAWLLKGQAINYQITASNQRILEAYNCIMTAYDVLPEEEKETEKYEVLSVLKDCMEGEVTFWVEQFEKDRPTEATLRRTKNAYVDAYNKMAEAFDRLGLQESKQGYLWNFDNFFVKKANAACVSSWKITVAYNFFRDDLDNLGAYWNRNSNRRENGTDYFRPSKETFTTFLDEQGILNQMLEFCVEQFNQETDEQQKIYIYDNLAYFTEVPMNQCSYKPMVTTWTNGYGAVTRRDEYYEVDTFLTDASKANRRKSIAKYKALSAEAKAAGEAKERAKKEREREEKRIQYWTDHAEEKAALEEEKAQLETQAAELETVIKQIVKDITPERNRLNAEKAAKLPEEDQLQAQMTVVRDLEAERSRLGLFKGKEKKAITARLEEVEHPKLKQLRAAAEAARKALNEKVEHQLAELGKEETQKRSELRKIRERIGAIDYEFKKDR